MSETVIRIPAEFKHFGEAVGELVGILENATSQAKGGAKVEYAKLERALSEGACAIERQAHGALLASLDVDAERICVRGKRYRRVGRFWTSFKTCAGPVPVRRTLYREVGQRRDKTIDPIALRTGAVAGTWLPATAKAMAFLVQGLTSREAQAAARELGRLPYSRSSFDRMLHAVGEVFEVQHADVEADLIENFEVPQEARSISASLDRVSVPMEEPLPGNQKDDDDKKAGRRRIARNYRMAYCGTVTIHDAKGEALHTIRYGCMPAGDEHGMCERMAADIRALLATRFELLVALLCDGAPEMWRLLESHINEETIGKKPERVIDFYHVIEKLSPALDAIVPESKAYFLTSWKIRLARQEGAAEKLFRFLKGHHARTGEWTEAEFDAVHAAFTYFQNNRDKMDYPQARRKGLPIGSGNVEATCKCLVTLRMKRCGSRWKNETGEHLIQLRALALSDRWDDGIDLMLATRATSVRLAA
jgi:hypothetical protein